MCQIPKVVIVAPADMHQELRKTLSSLEYDIAATVSSVDDASGITASVAIAWEPDEDALLLLRTLGLKTVAIGGTAETADMTLAPDEIPTFKSRIWELFRPA
jgi:hypothetical protein